MKRFKTPSILVLLTGLAIANSVLAQEYMSPYERWAEDSKLQNSETAEVIRQSEDFGLTIRLEKTVQSKRVYTIGNCIYQGWRANRLRPTEDIVLQCLSKVSLTSTASNEFDQLYSQLAPELVLQNANANYLPTMVSTLKCLEDSKKYGRNQERRSIYDSVVYEKCLGYKEQTSNESLDPRFERLN